MKKLGIRQTRNIEITEAGTKLREFSPSWLTKTAGLTTCEERKSLYVFFFVCYLEVNQFGLRQVIQI